MRIEIGQHLKTNYDTGPYRVEGITRDCTCAHVLDEIESIDTPLPPHMHLRLRFTEEAPAHNRGDEAWINYIDEETLRSYGAGGKLGRDRIIILENPSPIQQTIAFSTRHNMAQTRRRDTLGREKSTAP